MTLRKCTFMPDDHTRKNYFVLSNAIFCRELSLEALVVLMYWTRYPEEVCAASMGKHLGISESVVLRCIRELEEKGFSEPFKTLPVRGNFFLMPKVVFDLGLSLGAVAAYAYLMRSEDRETHQCYPSMGTIGAHIGRSRKSVMAYVRELEDKQLIYTEHTTVWGGNGKKRNANLRYTLRNIEDAKRYHYEQQVLENEKRAAKGRAA